MSKIGNWIIEREQNEERRLLLRYRNNAGSSNDLVRRDKTKRTGDSSHWTRFLEECNR